MIELDIYELEKIIKKNNKKKNINKICDIIHIVKIHYSRYDAIMKKTEEEKKIFIDYVTKDIKKILKMLMEV